MIFVEAVKCKVCLSYFISPSRYFNRSRKLCLLFIAVTGKSKRLKPNYQDISHVIDRMWIERFQQTVVVSLFDCISNCKNTNKHLKPFWDKKYEPLQYVFIEENCHILSWTRKKEREREKKNIHLEYLKEGGNMMMEWEYKSFCFVQENYLRRFFSQFNYVALWNFYLFLLMMFRFFTVYTFSQILTASEWKKTRER